MELVYLWVEDYKNIQNQGFNFSPRFHCEYNDKTKGLTIDKNDDYIPDFFSKNINVTAIVGKNGSGKSSVLDKLSLFATLTPTNNLLDLSVLLPVNVKKQIGNSFLIFYDFTNNTFIKSFGYFGDELDIIFLGKNIEYKKDMISEQFTLSYNFMLENRQEFYYYNFDLESHKLFVQPSKNDNILDFGLLDNESNKFLLINILELDETIQLINEFFIPYYFKLKIKDKFYFSLKEIDDNLFQKVFNFQHKVEKIKIKKDASFTHDDLKLLNAIYLVLYIDKQQNHYKITERYKEILNKNNFQDKVDFIFYHTYDDIFINDIPYIKHDFKILEEDNIKYIHNSKYTIHENMKLLDLIPNWMDITLYNENDISFDSLSNGEKFLIRLIYNMFFYLNKIKKENYKFVNILLDEVDIGLHPQWQKYFLKIIINFLKNHGIQLNIIFTTHSPFLLSDLPKENIIFLDTYKKENEKVKNGEQKIGNCKVLSHDEVLSKKQTFGANIHTLLSDSFFMEDGLMGEFAKGKINEIKRFYEVFTKYQDNKKIKKAYKWIYLKKRKKFEQIQLIIGEPFLKTVIKNYLDEIETILFKDKAKKMATERFIREFGEDMVREVLNDKSQS